LGFFVRFVKIDRRDLVYFMLSYKRKVGGFVSVVSFFFPSNNGFSLVFFFLYIYVFINRRQLQKLNHGFFFFFVEHTLMDMIQFLDFR
jgi:hypothetical protein